MSLRLGVQCAVIDDQGRVLLSQRGDLNVWNLPGGRLDSREGLLAGAAREVREETGIIAQIERPVGLSYWAGWRRMNILFAGWPLGGELVQHTAETRANRYFEADHLPKMLNPQLVTAALAQRRPMPEVISMSPQELRRIRRKLSWRWVMNLLHGQPEPRYPSFGVRVVGLIWDETYRRVITLPGKRGPVLPRVTSTGMEAPWLELSELVRQTCRMNPLFQWVGVWQDAPRNLFEFVFAATMREQPLSGQAEWSNVHYAALPDRDLAYVGRTMPDYNAAPVWIMQHEESIGHGDILPGDGSSG